MTRILFFLIALSFISCKKEELNLPDKLVINRIKTIKKISWKTDGKKNYLTVYGNNGGKVRLFSSRIENHSSSDLDKNAEIFRVNAKLYLITGRKGYVYSTDKGFIKFTDNRIYGSVIHNNKLLFLSKNGTNGKLKVHLWSLDLNSFKTTRVLEKLAAPIDYTGGYFPRLKTSFDKTLLVDGNYLYLHLWKPHREICKVNLSDLSDCESRISVASTNGLSHLYRFNNKLYAQTNTAFSEINELTGGAEILKIADGTKGMVNGGIIGVIDSRMVLIGWEYNVNQGQWGAVSVLFTVDQEGKLRIQNSVSHLRGVVKFGGELIVAYNSMTSKYYHFNATTMAITEISSLSGWKIQKHFKAPNGLVMLLKSDRRDGSYEIHLMATDFSHQKIKKLQLPERAYIDSFYQEDGHYKIRMTVPASGGLYDVHECEVEDGATAISPLKCSVVYSYEDRM